MRMIYFFLSLVSITAYAATDTNDMNKANNPLTPMLGANLQNYFTSSIFGTDKTSNTFLLRGTLPHKAGGLPQIMRVTMPYATVPDPEGGNAQGIGDFNIFDIFLFKPKNGFEFGVGPYFVFPTAAKEATGAGKWQAGASGMIIKPDPWGVYGALLTYQHDFAGPSDRPTQNITTFQPFVNINLPRGIYARSTAVWNFNLENGDYYIPVGAGLGKVWKLKNGVILNLFAEPQWTVFHEGDAQPNFQAFVGFNTQFPLE